MKFMDFTLDVFQEDAIKAIQKGQSVLVSAPTGSGKTLIADFIIDKDLKTDKRVIYTAPIKALSNQKYRDFSKQYGEDRIGLITGDLVINPQGQVLIMTAEVYRNMAIINDPLLETVSYCIMDEIHYINDEERGYIWEESIIFSPGHIRFLFLSATIPNSVEFASWVEHTKKHTVEVVKHGIRPVPLDKKFYDAQLGMTSLKTIQKQKELDRHPHYKEVFRGRRPRYHRARVPTPDFTKVVELLHNQRKLPAIYFVFSRLRTEQYAIKIAKKRNFLNEKERSQVQTQVREQLRSVSPTVLRLKSTGVLRQCLARGVAFHHAGLLPDTKHIVETLFAQGLIKVLFATETFAVGINMPAKTVVFDSLRKYTGKGFRYLTSKEYFQIAGRAGRRGIDKEGLAVSVIHRPAADLKKIAQFTKADKQPIKSQFKLSYNTVLNMVNLHTAQEIDQLLKMNFLTYQKSKGKPDKKEVLQSIKTRYDARVRTLTRLGYIKDGQLTHLGIFTTKIFANELDISQVFAGDFDFNFDEYTIMLALASIAYEEKKEVVFAHRHPSKQVSQFKTALRAHPYLRRKKWITHVDKMTSLIYPLYEQKKFIDILRNTSMPEGDLIRFFMQVLDRLEQVERASEDHHLRSMVHNAKGLIRNSLEGIHVF